MALQWPPPSSLTSLPPELQHPILPLTHQNTDQPLPNHTPLRSLILSSPSFWSSIEINIIQDVSCSPPLSFLRELFARSGNAKLSVRIVHWGEERRFSYENDDMGNRGWEWVPGAMREVRKVLERVEGRIEKMRFEFHDLNGTEYVTAVSRRERGQLKWQALKKLEMYAADWGMVHSLSMGWIEEVLRVAPLESVLVQGDGMFEWSVLGREMGRLRRLRVETEIAERVVLEIISRTPGLEESIFDRVVQVSTSLQPVSRHSEADSGSRGGIVLPVLRQLHIGSPRGAITPLLSVITTPMLQELGIGCVEVRETRWDGEAFRRFMERSGLENRLVVKGLSSYVGV
ncbi:hypothetical protein D9756_001227 [Leucocoprinus leucothites]|uniref:Uncharacterized protein n=1 Tax=Leucocoprinus leucothites TaxID=201217 RepID=A0A8H5LHZ5_9AGAR|nr:hypothetical protein D9756_001227 [Leucoagaricus leucothites]